MSATMDDAPMPEHIEVIDPAARIEPYFVAAGQTVIIHARYTYQFGPQDCVGIFRATRDFDPIAEHKLFTSAFPSYGPPETWTAKDRNDFVCWAIRERGFLEDTAPTYLFLEPWPAKPEAEKVSEINAS